MRVVHLFILFTSLLYGSALGYRLVVRRQLLPNLPDSIKKNIEEKRKAVLTDVNSKKIFDALVESIMSKADDYYSEFRKLSDDLNQEEDEAAKFEKFKEHLYESAQEFAPYLATTSNNALPEQRKRHNNNKEPRDSKKKSVDHWRKRVAFKNKTIDQFYDYNNFE